MSLLRGALSFFQGVAMRHESSSEKVGQTGSLPYPAPLAAASNRVIYAWDAEGLQARRGAGNGGSTLCEPADRRDAKTPPDRS